MNTKLHCNFKKNEKDLPEKIVQLNSLSKIHEIINIIILPQSVKDLKNNKKFSRILKSLQRKIHRNRVYLLM